MGGDYSPVELAWCTHMTEAQCQEVIGQFLDMKEEIRKNTYQKGAFYIVTYTWILASVITQETPRVSVREVSCVVLPLK